MGMENYNPPQEPWLVILYQDDHIMVVNKPSGLLSVPGRLEEHKDSVMTRIQRDYPQAESVHRLDMATSGVIDQSRGAGVKTPVPRARAKKAVCGPRLGASIPRRRSGGSAADLRLAKPPETESLLRNG